MALDGVWTGSSMAAQQPPWPTGNWSLDAESQAGSSPSDHPSGVRDTVVDAYMQSFKYWKPYVREYTKFSPKISLNYNGCLVEDPKTHVRIHNCTAACLAEGDAMWKGEDAMATLSNCLLYPFISVLMTYDIFQDHDLEIAKKFDIRNANDIDIQQAIQKPMECPMQYCRKNSCALDNKVVPFCESGILNLTLDTSSSSIAPNWCGSAALEYGLEDIDVDESYSYVNLTGFVSRFNTTYNTPGDFCDTIAGINRLSSDVLGRGVLISYSMQLTMAVFLWAVLGSTTFWPANILTWCFVVPRYLFCSWATRKQRFDQDYKFVSSLQRRLRNSKMRSGTLATMLEFQKAQCLFTIAVQVASIYGLYRKTSAFQVRALLTLLPTLENVQKVGVYQLCATAFGLEILVLHKKRSSFINTLTLLALMMSLFSVFSVTIASHSPLDILNARDATLDSCGYLDPARFCERSKFGRYHSNYVLGAGEKLFGQRIAGTALIIFLVTTGLIGISGFPTQLFLRILSKSKLWNNVFVRPVRVFLDLQRSLCQNHSKSPVMRLLHLHGIDGLWSFLWSACHAAWTIFLVVAVVQEIGRFTQLLGELLDASNPLPRTPTISKEWDFGQIIAVTIWLPVWIDWAYAVICGLEDSSNYRYPDEFQLRQVRRVDSQSQGEEENGQHTRTNPLGYYVTNDTLSVNVVEWRSLK